MSQVYGDSSIDQLVGAERIRRRPASMLGSSGLDGARHGFIEIYGNALDEHSSGYGNKLKVTYHADGAISLRDYGRGVPLGWNDKDTVKNWNWHVIYNELYGGGKYDNGQWFLQSIDAESEWLITDELVRRPLAVEFGVDTTKLPDDNEAHLYRDVTLRRNGDKVYIKVVNTTWASVTMAYLNSRLNYITSVGLNGLGAASTQYTSEYFNVKSYRDGKVTSRSFKRGIPLVNGEPYNMFSATAEEIASIPEEIEATDEPNGTLIHWKPDDTVFDNVDIGADWLFNTCRDIAGVAGIELEFTDETTNNHKVIPASTLDDILVSKNNGNLILDDNGSPVLLKNNDFRHGDTRVEGKRFVWVCKCDVAISFTKRETPNACFHNSVKMISGIQYEAINDAIKAFVDARGKEFGIKIDSRDYMDNFGVVVSSYSNYASFRNQTKDAVDDYFIYGIVKDAIFNKLSVEYGKKNKYVIDVVTAIVDTARERIQTEELRVLARKAAKVKREKTPDKFTSCKAYEDKKYEEVELWITEGDSAGGAVKDARDKRFQAVFAIRGKGLNVAKASIAKILANKEIREIFAILGTGFDLNIKGEKFFNIDDLKVGKIIFATDADEDGYQIRVLLFLTFYMLAPELITSGKVFIAETPRFGIDLVDGTRIYARNDADRDRVIAENTGRIKNIARYKGLGEVNSDVLHETTVSPATRTLIPVTCDLQNEIERELIDALFGADKYNQRKSIISAILGADVSDMIDDDALLLQDEDSEQLIDSDEDSDESVEE